MRTLLNLAGSMLCLALMAGPAHAAEADKAASPAAAPVPTAPALNSVGEGRRQFLKLNCYSCHGMDAKGGMGPRITHRDRTEVAAALTFGRPGGMRSFAGIVREVDITNITAYLDSIGTADEPTFNDWWIAVPPK